MPKLSLFAGAALVAVMLAAAPQVSVAKAKETVGAKPGDIALFRALLSQGYQKFEADDYAGAAESLQAAVNNPAFPFLGEKTRYSTLYFLALSENYSDQAEKGYGHLIEAGKVTPDQRDGYYWLVLCSITLKLKKNEEAVDAFTVVATTYPETLAKRGADYAYRVARAAKTLKDDNVRYQRLLLAMRAANYKPDNPFSSAEWVWLDLFKIYADKGDEAHARELLAGFTELSSVMELQIDRRYTAYAPADPNAYKTALDREIAAGRALAAAHPDLIEGAQSLASRLANTNQLPEALKVLDDALARADAAPKDKPAFSDLDEYLAWTLDQRSHVLRLMGRNDDAVAAMKKARDAALAVDSDTISQKINLGGLYVDLGRAQDALSEVKDIDMKFSSTYGVMAAEEVRACAYAQSGDKANLEKSLAYMREHADDGYEAVYSALLCANDIDGLVKMTLTRLEDTEKRIDALSGLQIYLPEPNATPWQKTLEARRAQVEARPEIKAAIAKYGFVRSYPIFRGGH